MTQPLFSILIAQYNNGQFFEDCYNSIIAQTYKNWEVIIVDDGSADDSAQVMKNLIGDDSRFKLYLNDKNEGCGFTKRRLAELASGELCAFLDPDDAITDEALEVMVAEHMKRPEASVIYSKPYFCDADLNIQYERESVQVENGDPNFFDFDGRIFAFLSYKQTAYRKTQGISSFLQRAVDKDLVLKLYETGSCFLFDKALYKYRNHGRSISLSGNEDKAYFWYWVAIIDAAKRRNVNIEKLFLEHAMNGPRQQALQKEVDGYNKSVLFKILRKSGLFKLL